MMDETRFWTIIETSRKAALSRPRKPSTDFADVHMSTLTEALEKLPPDEVAQFAFRFDEVYARAYRWQLWGAAYWLCGGCSDDGFSDFRSTLISNGRKVYEKAIANADSLAELIDKPDTPYWQSEGFLYIAGRVYKKLTGKELPESDAERQSEEPVGEQWDFDDADEMAKRLPKIFKKMPEMGD